MQLMKVHATGRTCYRSYHLKITSYNLSSKIYVFRILLSYNFVIRILVLDLGLLYSIL